jgi:hypothetical protein
LRLAKHAANNRPNFHYCKIWISDLVRKQTLSFICRCQSRSKAKNLHSIKCSKLCFCLKCRISFCIKHICGNIFVASALKAPSKMLGTSGAKSCSSPSQGPLAPPSLGVWVERPFM